MKSLATAYKELSARGLLAPNETLESFTVKMRDPAYLEKAAATLASEKGLDPGLVAQDYKERTEAWFDPANDNEFTRKFPQYRGISPGDSENVAEKFKVSTLERLSKMYKGDFKAFVENVQAGRKPVGGLTPNQAAMYQMVQRIVGASGLNVPGIQSVNDWGAYLQDPEMSQKNPYSPVVNNTIARNWDMDTPAQGSILGSAFPSATYRAQDPNVGTIGTAIGALEDVASAVPRAIGSALDATGVSKGTLSGGTPTEIASPGQQFLNYAVTGSVPGSLATKVATKFDKARNIIRPVQTLAEVATQTDPKKISTGRRLLAGGTEGVIYEAIPAAYLASQSTEREPYAKAQGLGALAVGLGLGATASAIAPAVKKKLGRDVLDADYIDPRSFKDRVLTARDAANSKELRKYLGPEPELGTRESRLISLDEAYADLLATERRKRGAALADLTTVTPRDAEAIESKLLKTQSGGWVDPSFEDVQGRARPVPAPYVKDGTVRDYIADKDLSVPPSLLGLDRLTSTKVKELTANTIRGLKDSMEGILSEGSGVILGANDRKAVREAVTLLGHAAASPTPMKSLIDVRSKIGETVQQAGATPSAKKVFGEIVEAMDKLLGNLETAYPNDHRKNIDFFTTTRQRQAAGELAETYPAFERLFKSREDLIPSRFDGATEDIISPNKYQEYERLLPEGLSDKSLSAAKARSQRQLTAREDISGSQGFQALQGRQKEFNDILTRYLPSPKDRADFIKKFNLPLKEGTTDQVDYLTPDIVQAALLKYKPKDTKIGSRENVHVTSYRLILTELMGAAETTAKFVGKGALSTAKNTPKTTAMGALGVRGDSNPLTLGAMVNMQGVPVVEWPVPQ